MAFFDEVKNILFANKDICYICLEKEDKQIPYICRNCYSKLELVNGQADIDSPYLNKIYYSLFYNRFIRDKISDFKFNQKNYLYKPFGQIMVNTAKSVEAYKEIDLILYIPSHRRKEAIRGYNQAELLAKYISESLNKPLSKGNLIKTKDTKEQSGLNKLERTSNLKGSFSIKDPKEIKSKKILLVDDIITTGITLQECSKVLMEKGASDIRAIALTSSKIQ